MSWALAHTSTCILMYSYTYKGVNKDKEPHLVGDNKELGDSG
jgi:hypothetical protein